MKSLRAGDQRRLTWRFGSHEVRDRRPCSSATVFPNRIFAPPNNPWFACLYVRNGPYGYSGTWSFGTVRYEGFCRCGCGVLLRGRVNCVVGAAVRARGWDRRWDIIVCGVVLAAPPREARQRVPETRHRGGAVRGRRGGIVCVMRCCGCGCGDSGGEPGSLYSSYWHW